MIGNWLDNIIKSFISVEKSCSFNLINPSNTDILVSVGISILLNQSFTKKFLYAIIYLINFSGIFLNWYLNFQLKNLGYFNPSIKLIYKYLKNYI